MPTIAIVGAGPRLGLSIAKLFGRNGYDVALIARDEQRLGNLVAELTAHDVKAAGFPADVADRPALVAALGHAADRFGPVDVLQYSAPAWADGPAFPAPLDLTPENLQPQFDRTCHGAVTATRAVLPAMRAAGTGTLLYTTGAAAVHPRPRFAAPGAAASALRNWVLNLNGELAGEGVYAGFVAIGVWIGDTPRPAGAPQREPDDLATTYWQLHTARTPAERVITA